MRPSGRYRQPPGHDRRWSGESDADGRVHCCGPTVRLQRHPGKANPKRDKGRGLHLPPCHEVPRRERGWRVPGKPGGREKVLHGGGQQSVPKGPCPDHCGNRLQGGRTRSSERRCRSAE
ncbi:hypothetical protein TIFTF001_011992 [Ficus carica]|uniref:Uncharacterized protein n=1 Tax=Ficus carica TaxID=3494 RepID=A0AA87ZY76_FICCA|nr:hypothetical protein TIFTF001_011992 [Ficus carica]